MNKRTKFISLTAVALLAISPVVFVPVNADAANLVAVAKDTKPSVTFSTDTPLITKQDKFIKAQGNFDTAAYQIKAGVLQTIPGATTTWTGKTWMFQGHEYLDLGNGGYVPTSSATQINGHDFLNLEHNSYVYNKKGQRIKKFRGQSKLLAGTVASYTGSYKSSRGKYFINTGTSTYKGLTYKTIKGKDYLPIGNGGYVKINNVAGVKGSPIYTKGPIMVKVSLNTNAMKYTKGKMVDTKTKLKKGQKLVVDQYVHVKAMDTEDPAIFYHIKGTKLYVDAVEAEPVSFYMVAKNI